MPMGYKDSNIAVLNNQGYCSIGIVSDKTNTLNIVKDWLGLLIEDYKITTQIKTDDLTTKRYFNELKSKEKKIYPMKSSGFLSRLSELHIKADDPDDFEVLLDNWGYFESLDILCYQEQNSQYIQEYLEQDLYNNKRVRLIFDFIKVFDFVICQSGDAEEVEIVFKKCHYDKVIDVINNYVKKAILGADKTKR